MKLYKVQIWMMFLVAQAARVTRP